MVVRLSAPVACLLLLTLGCGRFAARGEPEITLSTQLGVLTNTMLFAVSPVSRSAMLSCYDPTGGNEDWAKFPPPDSKGLITLATLKGPGCVNRIWMTTLQEIADEWLFFFDGEKEPRLRFAGADFFGKSPPFSPPLCDNASSGFYSYMPLPYARSLRIAISVPKLTPEMRPYYHINYETFPARTRVESFPRTPSTDQLALIAEVQKVWKNTESSAEAEKSASPSSGTIVLQPGESKRWLDQTGSGVLRSFWIDLIPPEGTSALRQSQLLRKIALRFRWDGQTEPSVSVPLGDFFCNGLFRRKFHSLPLTVTDRSFICRLPMPFRTAAVSEIENNSDIPIQLEIGHRIEPLAPDMPVNYFHAAWNSSLSRGLPFKVLSASGQGHLVGCYLTAIGMDGSWRILEGDDRIYVDREAVPSFHGTGLEDYFNGAWYYDGLFNRPLHGLVEKAPIRTSQYRFHLADRIGFENSLSFTFEFGDANGARGYMSSVAYWYQDEPRAATPALPPADRRFPPADP